MWNTAAIEEVPGVECAVAEKFIGRSVKLIRAVRSDDVYLRTWSLAVLGAVCILDHGEFTHGGNTEKLSTEPPRRVVHFRRAGEFDSGEQKQIFLGTAARDG